MAKGRQTSHQEMPRTIWTVSQALNKLNRLDEMITENIICVEELEKSDDEFSKKLATFMNNSKISAGRFRTWELALTTYG